MNTNTMTCGLDGGIRKFAAVGTNRMVPACFPSAVARGRTLNPLAPEQETDICLEWNGEPWVIGPAALAEHGATVARSGETKQWFLSQEYLLMALAAISRITAGHVAVDLWVGVPLLYYDKQFNAALAAHLAGQHTITHRPRDGSGRRQTITVETVHVRPQTFAAVMPYVATAKGEVVKNDYSRGRTLVWNIGSGTTALFAFDGSAGAFRPVAQVCQPVGGWQVVKAVREKLVKRFPNLDRNPDHVFEAYTLAGKLFYNHDVDIRPEIAEAKAAVWPRLAEQAAKFAGDDAGEYNKVVGVGGGPLLFRPEIGGFWPRLEIPNGKGDFGGAVGCPDPVMAAALGLYLLGTRNRG